MKIKKIAKSIKEGKFPQARCFPEKMIDAGAAVSSFRGKFSRLTPLERLLTTVRHKEPDRVPVAPLANAVARRIVGIPFPEYLCC